MAGLQAVPGEEELLSIFRKLSPHIRQSILKITQDLLEAQTKADTQEMNEVHEKNRA
ncbi:MAG: hypothetical protein LBD93_01415 [Treponema sp.]|nr:hypothetical protein [Treponema sp.]